MAAWRRVSPKGADTATLEGISHAVPSEESSQSYRGSVVTDEVKIRRIRRGTVAGLQGLVLRRRT